MKEASFKETVFPFAVKLVCAAILSGVGLLILTVPASADAVPGGLGLYGTISSYAVPGYGDGSIYSAMYTSRALGGGLFAGNVGLSLGTTPPDPTDVLITAPNMPGLLNGTLAISSEGTSFSNSADLGTGTTRLYGGSTGIS